MSYLENISILDKENSVLSYTKINFYSLWLSISLEKLRLKEDKKLKRKIQKQEAKKLAQERMEEDLKESNLPKNEEPEGIWKYRLWK